MKRLGLIPFALAALLIGVNAAFAYEALVGPLGVLQYKPEQAFNGYTLVTPQTTTSTYLIDMEGNVINEWISEYIGFSAELLPNGNMARHSVIPGGWPVFGGTAGLLEEFDWDGNVVWSFQMYDEGKYVSHHTFEVMPNGNYLVLGWEYKTYEEVAAKGRDMDHPSNTIVPGGIRQGDRNVEGMWPDFIWEISRETKEVVWEWHVWDHTVNYDDYNHLNINKFLTSVTRSRSQAGPDWTHFNGLAYFPETRQVCITSRSLAEVYVINYDTGELVYRWGNPYNWGGGRAPGGYYDDGDQKLFGPHAPDWTVEGNISILDNGDGRPTSNYTRAVEIDPRTDSMVWEWKPTDVGTISSNYYSFNQSGAQKLGNGNYLITATTSGGHTIEVTPQKEVVWEFINPMMGRDNVAYSVSSPHGQMASFAVHKCYRYAYDDPRFAGKDLGVIRTLLPEGTPNWRELYQFNQMPDPFAPN